MADNRSPCVFLWVSGNDNRCYGTNALSLLPLLILEPDYDDQDQWLQSFPDLKFKTNQTLYVRRACDIHFSRQVAQEGSVDARIQALVKIMI
jgi:hypothetical protein